MRQVNEPLRQQAVAARKAAGLSQHKAADLAGVARCTVIRWEKGENWPGDFVIRAYIQALEGTSK